jgi:hypothetical protein
VTTLKKLKYKIYFDLFNFLMFNTYGYFYFLVLMSSLLFYNVENSKKERKTLECVGVSKPLTGTVLLPGKPTLQLTYN